MPIRTHERQQNAVEGKRLQGDRKCMQKVHEKMEGKLSLVSLHGVGA